MRVAFIFPGQGSQSVAMMTPYEGLPAVRDTFDEASEVLGQDLWALAQEGPEDAQARTVNTQPLMLVAGVALYRAWKALGGPDPLHMAGHSLAEYTALVCSGALDLRMALPLLRFRAQAMQAAVPEGTGGMAAILGLEDVVVRQVCAEAAAVGAVEPANFNAPGQVVIAGTLAGIDAALELAKARGARRGVKLAMSVPSHCSLQRDASEELAARLDACPLRAPRIPVINNADVLAQTDPVEIRDALVRQLYSPVRWVETVRALVAPGIDALVECGPGGVLASLAKRTVEGVTIATLKDASAFTQLLGAAPAEEAR